MVSQWKVVGYTDGRGRWAISRSEYHTRLEAWWLRGPLWLQLRGLLLTSQPLTPRSVGPINFASVFWNWPRERTVKSLAGFQLLFLCRAAFCPYSPKCLVWSGLGAHTDICKGAPTAISVWSHFKWILFLKFEMSADISVLDWQVQSRMPIVEIVVKFKSNIV